MSVFILDVETTGFEEPIIPLEVARIKIHGDPREMAYDSGAAFHQFYNPGRSIEWGAVSAHHILPDDVADKPKWDSPVIGKSGDFFVGHNVDYDWAAVGSPAGVKRICTLAMSRHLEPEMDAHRLGAMVYRIFGQTPEARGRVQRAHSALHDAGMAAEILIWAIKQFEDRGAIIRNWDDLHLVSEMARIPLKMNFGKNKGVWIKDLNSHDPGYIRWALKGMKDMDPYLRKAFLAVGTT